MPNEINVPDEQQLRVNEHEPNTAISITAAQSHHGRMAQAGHDDSEGQETISEHQEEYENASSAPGSIVDHEIKSEKVGFNEQRRFRKSQKAEKAFTVAMAEDYPDEASQEA